MKRGWFIVSLTNGEDHVRVVIPAAIVDGSGRYAIALAEAELPRHHAERVTWRPTLDRLDTPAACASGGDGRGVTDAELRDLRASLRTVA